MTLRKAIREMEGRDLLAAGTFTRGQFDWVVLDATLELDAEQSAQVSQIARRAVLTLTNGTCSAIDPVTFQSSSHVAGATVAGVPR